jgi:gamma-glutamylcyclotransferase (GGCT)/AIG2-like uncharacterized protein YtfP
MVRLYKVFIYGTLLTDDSRPNQWGRQVKVYRARYASVKGKLFVHGVPYIILGGEDRVFGKVFEIDDDTMMEYDSIEGIYPGGVGGWYEKRKVKALYDDGKEEEVWIYCRPEYIGGEAVPNGQYDNWKDDDVCPIPEDKRGD